MWKWVRLFVLLPVRHHLWGSFAIMMLVTVVMTDQIVDRRQFASGELHDDVMDRWGAPIVQPVPSVRAVESGSVFNELHPLPFEGQDIEIRAAMSYRKRGLVYFSGFDFDFNGRYRVKNDQGKDLDVVFVFPINLEKNKVLLSELSFLAGGQPAKIDLAETTDKLVWTGRVASGEEVAFDIHFKGRGLDAFTYLLDPSLPVRGFRLALEITGGDNFDYADGVVPATSAAIAPGRASLEWRYASLESGVPVGVILPSEKAFDDIIATMLRRSWATFLLFFACVVGLSLHYARPLASYESYLVSSAFAFFYVLLAYFSAYLSFPVAYVLAMSIIGGLIHVYLKVMMGREAGLLALAMVAAFLFLPTLAVVLTGYTGLIYTVEILAGLAALMYFTARPSSRVVIDRVLGAAGAAVVLLGLLVPGVARAEGSATLPLEEVLRLHRASEPAPPREPAPPVPASINKIELRGRLLADAVEVDAKIEVAVLSAGGWVVVPLLAKDARTHVSKLPAVEGGSFAVQGGRLCFVTRQAGVHAFELQLSRTAELEGRRRTARLDFEPATLSMMRVELDAGLFALSGARVEADGARLFPEGGRYTLSWEQIAAIDRSEEERARRPPVESVVARAHATTVSTLEGKQITRLLYELRFEGAKAIDVALPEGTSLDRVYVNGIAAPFAVKGHAVTVQVTPARAGDGSGRLELVLSTPRRSFYLSGGLAFTMPLVSWPVHELYADVFLPQVFNYRWTGGSLAPVEQSPEVAYTYDVPAPGKKLSFHQYLIAATAPGFELVYTVDLEGRYFRRP